MFLTFVFFVAWVAALMIDDFGFYVWFVRLCCRVWFWMFRDVIVLM